MLEIGKTFVKAFLEYFFLILPIHIAGMVTTANLLHFAVLSWCVRTFAVKSGKFSTLARFHSEPRKKGGGEGGIIRSIICIVLQMYSAL